jgi:uncharacterized membrane protein YphA (DoxX/SURF4 family)
VKPAPNEFSLPPMSISYTTALQPAHNSQLTTHSSQLSIDPTLPIFIQNHPYMKSIFNFTFLVKVLVAAILLQTLYFKFTGSEESVYIFTTMGIEPWGRIGSGVVELIAALLILIPRFTWLGALLALGVMCGAIFSHLTKLGIEVMEDGGFLFILACAVFLGSLYLLWINRRMIPVIGEKVRR